MNPNTVITLIALFALGVVVETYFSPRLDFTENRDLLLFYYNIHGKRTCFILWHNK